MENKIKVERDKTYRLMLEHFDSKSLPLLIPLEQGGYLYPKTKNFRYTHYINCWGCNINQVNNDYMNDCIEHDDPIAISTSDNKLAYVRVLDIWEVMAP